MPLDIRNIAYALDGRVISRNQVAAPGPGHSRRDRSLVVTLDANAPDGFVVNSFAGEDWREGKDYVRARLGLPAWQPGDDQDRRIAKARIANWDASSINAEVNEGPRVWTERDQEH